MLLTLSRHCRTCSATVPGDLPSGPLAPWPETYRKSPARMPGLYGPTTLVPAGKITLRSAAKAGAHSNTRTIHLCIFVPSRGEARLPVLAHFHLAFHGVA